MRPRRPDTEDLLKMKEETDQEWAQRRAEHDRLTREIQAQEVAEQQKQQYEEA